MFKFVNEHMTPAEQVDFAWNNRPLFERCAQYSLHRLRLRLAGQPDKVCGLPINGWMVDADERLRAAWILMSRSETP
jgi:hypothetical protein